MSYKQNPNFKNIYKKNSLDLLSIMGGFAGLIVFMLLLSDNIN